MFEINRRSAISTSELGLYSDRSEHRCHSKGYGTVVIKQFVIGSMIVITIVLIALFLYDVTSSASVLHKQGQETNHLFILQNSFGKLYNTTTKMIHATSVPIIKVNRTTATRMQDRSDTDDSDLLFEEDSNYNVSTEFQREDVMNLEPESRAENLQNFQLRKRLSTLLDAQESEENRFDNHAMVYHVKHSIRKPIDDEDEDYSQESLPSPFHFKFKTPYPSSFKRQKYPQLSQYQYPHSSRSIQDIIKYLTNNPENPPKGIKFSGVYVSPKKYDTHFNMMSSSDDSEEEKSASISAALNEDPLYRYKPKHPADVNLLATSNVRFSPSGVQRYTQYQNPYYNFRPGANLYKHPMEYDSAGAYSTTNNYNKKRKLKPFSVMLDIYPITDISDQTKKTSRPRPQIAFDDYDVRKPMPYIPRHTRNHVLQQTQSIPIVTEPNRHSMQDEEEKQQMILHLNLYPRKKSMRNRNEILQRSEIKVAEDRDDFMEKMSPFQMITKQLNDHFAIEKSKFEEVRESESKDIPIFRYEDIFLEKTNESKKDKEKMNTNNESEDTKIPLNHKPINLDNVTKRNHNESWAEKLINTTVIPFCQNCENSTTGKNGLSTKDIDIDTVEGFQKFADGLLATE